MTTFSVTPLRMLPSEHETVPPAKLQVPVLGLAML
jgi:hypothetical protein